MLFKMRYKTWAVLALVSGLSAPTISQAETLYISSLKAQVFSEPNFKSNLIVALPKGTAVESLDKQGTWFKVSYQNDTGWLSKFLVKNHPPLEKITVLEGKPGNELKDVRRRTSAITTAAAARGLAASARQEDTTQNTANLAGVIYMESFDFSEQELNQFADAIQKDPS